MPLSFTLSPHLVRSPSKAGKRSVLVTGAAGRIGSFFARHAAKKYDLRLLIKSGEDAAAIKSFGRIIEADIADLRSLDACFDGVDTVVHLAANASPGATWDELLPANVVGTYNVFAAAKKAKVRRVIYASSIHAVSGYPQDKQVHTADPVNPQDLYGVTKCFGEALARYMAEREGLSSICIRIGMFDPPESAMKLPHHLDAWVSPRDLQQLIERSIDDDRLQFAIFHGSSDNPFKRLDISDARELLMYHPQDSAAQERPPGESSPRKAGAADRKS